MVSISIPFVKGIRREGTSANSKITPNCQGDVLNSSTDLAHSAATPLRSLQAILALAAIVSALAAAW